MTIDIISILIVWRH